MGGERQTAENEVYMKKEGNTDRQTYSKKKNTRKEKEKEKQTN